MTKQWYRSKTVWGALLALAGALAGVAGVETDPAVSRASAEILTQLTTAGGALLALYGRFRASAAIG